MAYSNNGLRLIRLGFICLILGVPVYLKVTAHVTAPASDSPPVANNDTFNRHGNGAVGNVLLNDSDPDGDPLISAGVVTQASHGTVSPLTAGFFNYQLTNPSFVGVDSFTYQACAAFNVCSAPATVTINVVNQAPTAVNDSYTVHGNTVIGPMMVNDFDPDGDSMSWEFLNPPSHGTVNPIAGQPPFDSKRFDPANPYTGADSFTYKVCDSLGLCSAPATVSLNIVNNPPTPGSDEYTVRGTTVIGPVKVNDSDPDGDQLGTPSVVVGTAHGSLLGLSGPFFSQDQFQYTPAAGFAGTDIFVYRICDLLQKCSDTTVTLHVEGDGQNQGSCDDQEPASGPKAVGEPVDITNGNIIYSRSITACPAQVTRSTCSELITANPRAPDYSARAGPPHTMSCCRSTTPTPYV
jgi:large repetitive protein